MSFISWLINEDASLTTCQPWQLCLWRQPASRSPRPQPLCLSHFIPSLRWANVWSPKHCGMAERPPQCLEGQPHQNPWHMRMMQEGTGHSSAQLWRLQWGFKVGLPDGHLTTLRFNQPNFPLIILSLCFKEGDAEREGSVPENKREIYDKATNWNETRAPACLEICVPVQSLTKTERSGIS